MNSIEKLTEVFSKFPGIGPRQAKRFVYYLLTRNNGYLDDFSSLVKNLRSEIQECSVCHRFFQKDASGSTICDIDRNSNRAESGMLMVVSRDVDLENIERTHTYLGTYFVLGGSVPILEQNPEDRIRQGSLVKLIQERATSGKLIEIILAMNVTPEGENTADYLARLISPLVTEKNIKVSELGKGISTGTELEYSDSETIKNALKNRA
jgi:recombination protein RecR